MSFEINFTDSYPVAKRSNHQRTYHGVSVPAPYDYMEDPDNPDTKKFVDDNNALFDRFIDRSLIHKYQEVFAKYIGFSLYTIPSKHAGKYFFTKNDGKEPQGRFYSQDPESGEVKELFNFNTLSTNGTSSALITSVSPNGKFLATNVSKHGSDWQTLLVINLDSGIVQESIPWLNFTRICWLADSSAFYYTRFPDQTDLPLEERRRSQKVFYHVLGSDFNHDPVIYDPQDKDFTTILNSSSDHQWLIFSTNKSTMPQNKLFLQRMGSTDPLIEVITELDDNSYKVIDIIDQTVYCLTTWNAPNRRLMTFKVDNSVKDSWTEVIPERSFVLEDVHLANHNLILTYNEDVKHVMYKFTLDGKQIGKITLPGIGSIFRGLSSQLGIYSDINDTELFYAFTSFFDPPTIYRYDFTTDASTVFFGKPLSVDTSKYIVKQIFYSSKDGTKIPMFILHHKDIVLDGNNKTILYGYGGYNISLYPSFIPRYLAWLEQGGVYAIPNLRGGGEYGKKWHYQGILEHKQNVFDDFIAAAEYLIANKYTTTKKLAINGRSNGGLLAGACLVQRPDLYGVVVPEVGVLDMLRFKYFQAGRFWAAEYGDAEANEEHFKFLMKYSPLHNASNNSQYPPTLVVAAEADDRVVPMHTKKFTAALQHAQQAKNPIFMKIETKTGHGFGKSTQQQIDDNAFIFAFIDQIFSHSG